MEICALGYNTPIPWILMFGTFTIMVFGLLFSYGKIYIYVARYLIVQTSIFIIDVKTAHSKLKFKWQISKECFITIHTDATARRENKYEASENAHCVNSFLFDVRLGPSDNRSKLRA
jgi:hypothetical protein